MSVSYRQNRQPWLIEITDIIEEDEDTYRVILKATGKPASIRRVYKDKYDNEFCPEIFPGAISVPAWLYNKIIKST